MQPLPRPEAVNAANPRAGAPAAVTAIAVILAGLTVASWLLHLEFSAYFGESGLAHVRIEGLSGKTLNRVGEWGKASALLGAGAVLVLPRRRRGQALARGSRVAAVVGMVGAAAAYGLAVVYDGALLVLGFLFAALASFANSLTGGRGLPGAHALGVGLAAVAVDVGSLVLALICVALLSAQNMHLRRCPPPS